ncbi:hypothetical protein RBH29_04670 [Herbivorax sp. ANBcel31]|uniref:symporter small accessory protein n=1 Tax=Herbivorax sp. ANBcel31 TaxID=3069754 RepID=UPI0027B1601E|nr:symporter small accessory protein [Herbivorax sp. ANBcel31]MDQ2085727.1 hypothetical protein [Herbivorax sp. ANBcel31]
MLGLPDFWIWSVYLLCILSTVVCVVYGLLNWNKGIESEEMDIKEEETWEEKEREIESNL